MCSTEHASRYGVAVAQDAASRSKFVARLRAAPARALDVRIGLTADGQRVLQATWADEHDSALWRDLLRAFALRTLARERWLVSGRRRAIGGEGEKSADAGDADASSCMVV